MMQRNTKTGLTSKPRQTARIQLRRAKLSAKPLVFNLKAFNLRRGVLLSVALSFLSSGTTGMHDAKHKVQVPLSHCLLRKAFDLKKDKINTQHSVDVKQRDAIHQDTMQGITNERNELLKKLRKLDQCTFAEISKVQTDKHVLAMQVTETLRNESSERKKKEMDVLTKFNADAVASITALVDANVKTHTAQHSKLQDRVDSTRTIAQNAALGAGACSDRLNRTNEDVRIMKEGIEILQERVTANRNDAANMLRKANDYTNDSASFAAKAREKMQGSHTRLRKHVKDNVQGTNRSVALMRAALEGIQERKTLSSETPSSESRDLSLEQKMAEQSSDIDSKPSSALSDRLTAGQPTQRRRLPANYNALGPAEQCLARRRLARRPQTHIRVMEALLEEIKRSS